MSETGWHSVTEPPPYRVGDPEYRGYLVCVDYGGYQMLRIADYTYEDPDDDLYSFHVDGEYEPGVTHWMRLPIFPEEENDG